MEATYDYCPECDYPKLASERCSNPVCRPGFKAYAQAHQAWSVALKAAGDAAVARLGWNARYSAQDAFTAANPEPTMSYAPRI